MTPAKRCPALLACADGSFVSCTFTLAADRGARFTHPRHVGYVDGYGRATWADYVEGAASAVSLVSRRRLAGLLEVRS